jgi:transposase
VDPDTRAEHDRDELRYPSDLTDAERQILAPLLPPPAETGRHRSWPMREMMNAIFFVLRGGCPWRMLPEHFPPHQTVYRWFTRLRDDRTWARLNHLLVMRDRERVGRASSSSAAVIDSQSVKTTEAGGPRGYDAGTNINGRKPHAMVDTAGPALKLQVHPASIQDRDGAIPLLQASRALYPFIERAFADSAYAAERVTNATRIIVEIAQTGRPDRLCRASPPLGGRALLRLVRAQSPSRQGLRGDHRFRNRVPLRRFRPAPHSTARSFGLRFESDSNLQSGGLFSFPDNPGTSSSSDVILVQEGDPVPEPASMLLPGPGPLALGLIGRHRRA